MSTKGTNHGYKSSRVSSFGKKPGRTLVTQIPRTLVGNPSSLRMPSIRERFAIIRATADSAGDTLSDSEAANLILNEAAQLQEIIAMRDGRKRARG